MTTAVADRPRLARGGLAVAIVAGAVVAVCLGVYARVHHAAGRPVFTLGFSGVLQMKAWLATIVLVARHGPAGDRPRDVGPARHPRVRTGRLGDPSVERRDCLRRQPAGGVPLHLVAGLRHRKRARRRPWRGGCAFYGAYTAKMVGLRLDGLPKWALPVLGGAVLSLVVLTWLTASLWFFTRSGVPLT